ncbi:hypothetical protein [Flavobacterium sp. ov086]|uniref:hypothetical protein n=1 Tax=Flavobacterium sp. ov086 TaxID=1761785 RepID=UPI000B737F15|nr:hypothetical protein [Flavobacterium sp. ov086]SNR25062.1 hypothetical protein SAMN04487979_101390 [Flavobacterium sp. ov086]
MQKDEKNEVKNQSKNAQLSLEFSNKPIINQSANTVITENSKVISLSEYQNSDKGKIDYTNMVLKFTKSF